MKNNDLIRGASAVSILAGAVLLVGGAAVPGGYLLIWAFNHFLIDDVFTGNLPGLLDMTGFCIFFGSALLIWEITLIMLLGAVVRVLPGIRTGASLKGRIDGFTRAKIVPLLPFSWPERLYRKLSG